MNARIQSMLSFVPADDRETWLMAAMAIRSEYGDEGFDAWDQWSSTADNYKPADARNVWKSCRGSGVTMGSLIYEARTRGWRDDDQHVPATPEQIEQRRIDKLARQTREGVEIEARRQQAAKKAGWIMHQTLQEEHAYLHTKGFPEVKGAVWRPDDEHNLLCIPMRYQGALCGLQMVNKHGEKRFLSGQRTAGAEYMIDNSGRGALDWWVEGYASGLSLRACLQALKLRYRIHICFSAGNLKAMASSGVVIADHDASETGEKAAQATRLPYWMPPEVGMDINDFHKQQGLFRASQAIGKWLRSL